MFFIELEFTLKQRAKMKKPDLHKSIMAKFIQLKLSTILTFKSYDQMLIINTFQWNHFVSL